MRIMRFTIIFVGRFTRQSKYTRSCLQQGNCSWHLRHTVGPREILIHSQHSLWGQSHKLWHIEDLWYRRYWHQLAQSRKWLYIEESWCKRHWKVQSHRLMYIEDQRQCLQYKLPFQLAGQQWLWYRSVQQFQSHIVLLEHRWSQSGGLPLFQPQEAGRDSGQFVQMNQKIPLDWDVFVSNLFLWDLNVFDLLFRNVLRDVLSEVFDSVVISDSHFLGDGFNLALLSVFHLFNLFGDSFYFGLILVFDDFLFEGHVFDSALSFDHFLSGIDCGSDNLSSCYNSGGSSRNDSSSHGI